MIYLSTLFPFLQVLTQLASKIRDAVEREKKSNKLSLGWMNFQKLFQSIVWNRGLAWFSLMTFAIEANQQNNKLQSGFVLVIRPAERSTELQKAVSKDLEHHMKKMQNARELLQSSLDKYEDWSSLYHH